MMGFETMEVDSFSLTIDAYLGRLHRLTGHLLICLMIGKGGATKRHHYLDSEALFSILINRLAYQNVDLIHQVIQQT